MAFDQSLNPDWFYELPFYLVALMFYGVLFTLNPALHWGNRERIADVIVPIEFVSAASLTVSPPNVPLQPPPRPSVAPVKPTPAAKSAVKTKSVVVPSDAQHRRREAEKTRKAAADSAAKAHAFAMRAQKAQAQARAEAQEARAQAAHERAEAARLERERLSAVRAAKARKKAELSQELATMADPDETLDQKTAATPVPSRDAQRKHTAASLSDNSDSDDFVGSLDQAPAQLAQSRASKGPAMPDSTGVSYLLEGPIGNRRVIERVLPKSPDWVGRRGLDLTVTIRFQVLADGRVKSGAVIEKTSGFPEIDQSALKAVREWIFESAPATAAQTWGRVTLRFMS